jgi:hypothetical protein
VSGSIICVAEGPKDVKGVAPVTDLRAQYGRRPLLPARGRRLS